VSATEHRYQCGSCGFSYPPTKRDEQELAIQRQQRDVAIQARLTNARKLTEELHRSGKSTIWVPGPLKLSRRREADGRKAEKELDDLLSGMSVTKKRGPKSGGAYQLALWHKEVAKLFGRKLKISELANIVLPHDRTDPKEKIDKLRKGLSRLEKKSKKS
jgi:hypothetical protein